MIEHDPTTANSALRPRRQRIAGARTWLVLVFAAAILGCGPRPSTEARGRGVLLIVIDGLRADHVHALGYDRATTPTLDGLAARGIAFSDMWSNAPEILPAHAAILTGSDPLLARRPHASADRRVAEISGWHIPDEVPRVAQAFLSHGFATAAFVDHPAISEVNGFAKGFQEFFAFRQDSVTPRIELGFESVASKLVRWLGELPPGRDWFAYVHVNDLDRLWGRHDPDPLWDTFFEPRPEMMQVPPVAEAEHVFFAVPRTRWSGGTLSLGEYEVRYDGALRQLDKKLARLLERIRRGGRLDDTTIAIAGSYGISFGESGLYLDSGTLTAADLRVPWIVRPALRFECRRGTRVDDVASSVDIAPTLLEMCALPVPRGMQGVSQIDALRARGTAARSIAYASGGLCAGIAAIDARYLYEESSPPSIADDVLAASWHGEHGVYVAERLRTVHVRSETAGRSTDLENSYALSAPETPPAAAQLAQSAREWFEWVTKARDVLQKGREERERVDPALELELEKRGFLAGK